MNGHCIKTKKAFLKAFAPLKQLEIGDPILQDSSKTNLCSLNLEVPLGFSVL